LFPSADARKQGRKIAFFNIQRAAQPSPEIAQSFNGGYGWLQVKYRRSETDASIPPEHVSKLRDTPIWKLRSHSDRAEFRSTRRRHT